MGVQVLISVILLSSPVWAQEVATTVVHTLAPSTITIGPSSTPPSPQYTEASQLRSAVLNSTNTYRHQHNASNLVWNDTLAEFADDHVGDCKFAHSNGPYGENLAQGYQDITSSIDAWGQERKEYDFDDGGFAAETGHFTQLVWKNTTSVGCAAEDCGKNQGWLVFCEYWPQGNVMTYFQDQVQEQVNKDVNKTDTGSGALIGGPSNSDKNNDSGASSVQVLQRCVWCDILFIRISLTRVGSG